ncbi:MAG: 50S ribosomal protein L9 [Ilumatobacteraceae bacterium]|nr:MAG: 50S ribosomal protein L9 [Actinomycetota bacterium]
MKVILRADIDQLGKRGDIVDVRDGHARNYLFPRGLAMTASEGAVSQAAAMRRARDLRDTADREAAQTVASALVPKVITMPVKAGAEGRLYGSVTAADVVEAVEAQTGIVLDRRRLAMPDHIKQTGEYHVMTKLHQQVEFPITIDVVAK